MEKTKIKLDKSKFPPQVKQIDSFMAGQLVSQGAPEYVFEAWDDFLAALIRMDEEKRNGRK